jgi:threonine dehydrogenase-like Zn-dependent dehydrogenase
MIPATQYAVQLVGPSELKLNTSKEVFKPGPHQVLCKVEAVGLCFSDLKLLKQFTEHPRKSGVVKGLGSDVLNQIPSYVPGTKPTVPGHEVTCRIVAVGENVKRHQVGERVLVQTDYRDLPTAGSASAFGYNFEGALQEYVLMDERVVIDSTGERFLIPVDETLSASAICLVEPWACVEDSYVNEERATLKSGGSLLIVSDAPLATYLGAREPAVSGEITAANAVEVLRLPLSAAGGPRTVALRSSRELADLPNEGFDDIIVCAPVRETVELLSDKLAARGIINIVQCGQKLGAAANIGVGRVHYGMTRWIGTTGNEPAESYRWIPATGEIRDNDTVEVIGAGGPMGQMHVIRDVCAGKHNVKVVATDMDDSRLASLGQKAQPLAKARGASLRLVNTAREKLTEKFSYIALMAPVPALVAAAVNDAAPACLINIFAGIPAPVKHPIDLDTYIERHCYMFGTSGSTIRDMKLVLQKVQSGQLDTNCSVDAVSGMAGAKDGIAAVENRTLAGKIIVYPQLHELPLTPLTELPAKFPTVAKLLKAGQWTRDAEQELLRVAK